MNTFYKLVTDINNILKDEPAINSVTYGNIDDVDLNKTTLFPMAHTMPGNAVIQDRIIVINVSLLLMDIVNMSKDPNDNEQDVLNMMLAIAARFDAELKRKTIHQNEYELQGALNCEPFVERFENNLAGWTVTFSVAMKNTMTSC